MSEDIGTREDGGRTEGGRWIGNVTSSDNPSGYRQRKIGFHR